jgi:hypothetical protein
MEETDGYSHLRRRVCLMGGLALFIAWLGVNYLFAALLAYRAERRLGVHQSQAIASAAIWPKRLLDPRLA